MPRGKYEDVRELEEAGQFRLITKAGETDVVETKLSGAAFKRSALLAVAN